MMKEKEKWNFLFFEWRKKKYQREFRNLQKKNRKKKCLAAAALSLLFLQKCVSSKIEKDHRSHGKTIGGLFIISGGVFVFVFFFFKLTWTDSFPFLFQILEFFFLFFFLFNFFRDLFLARHTFHTQHRDIDTHTQTQMCFSFVPIFVSPIFALRHMLPPLCRRQTHPFSFM